MARRKSSEVRKTSKTGGQKGVKPEQYGLIPVAALRDVARVYGYGATKYAENNWRKGYSWRWTYDAMQRHLNAFWEGECLDPESGLPHLAHAAFHCLSLMTFCREQKRFDDRWQTK